MGLRDAGVHVISVCPGWFAIDPGNATERRRALKNALNRTRGCCLPRLRAPPPPRAFSSSSILPWAASSFAAM